MRLTLLRAKEAVARFSPADELEYRINRVCERFLTNGKFVGSISRLAIAAPYGQLTLPRQFRAVEGINVNGFNYQLGSQWFEFLPGKYSCTPFSMSGVRDLGDGHGILYSPRITETVPLDPTVPANDIPVGGTITVDYAGSDVLVTTIYGADIQGMPVNLPFVGKQTQANPFARISRIHKEIGKVSVRVTFTTDDAIQTILALMEPTEEETFYRRYVIDSIATCAQNAVVVLAKRRHIEFTRDDDVLPFGNVGALENGMNALNFEKENDKTLADSYWATGVKILNDDLNEAMPSDQIPPFRIKWIGGSPNLTSRY